MTDVHHHHVFYCLHKKCVKRSCLKSFILVEAMMEIYLNFSCCFTEPIYSCSAADNGFFNEHIKAYVYFFI